MEKLELKQRPEIAETDIYQLLSIIDSLKFEYYEQFEFLGKNFMLILLDPEDISDESYQDAWFSRSTAIDGTDIYILRTLEPETKKEKLFHEVIEARAQLMGYQDEIAHNYAAEQQKKFFTKNNSLNN